MRSRLEARHAAMFDNFGWRWSYEPLDLQGMIPDFMLWGRVIAEVKPTTDIALLATRRDALHRLALPWITDTIRGEAGVPEADRLADIERVRRGEDATCGPRVIMLGGDLIVHGNTNTVTVDGQHYLTLCASCKHGLARTGEACLRCGSPEWTPMTSSNALLAWRTAGNATRWVPGSDA